MLPRRVEPASHDVHRRSTSERRVGGGGILLQHVAGVWTREACGHRTLVFDRPGVESYRRPVVGSEAQASNTFDAEHDA